MSDFEFEMKRCWRCKEEKVRVVFFPEKGDTCIECKKALNKKYKPEVSTDPKRDWKRVSFGLKRNKNTY